MKILWESPSGCIKKKIITEGEFTRKPTERSECRVKIEDVIYPESSSGDNKNIDELLKSEYLRSSSGDIVVTIGNASSKVDEYVEKVIQTMFIKEESFVEITSSDLIENSSDSLRPIGFTITLISCHLYKPIWKWTGEEKYKISLRYKEAGVSLYKTGRIVEAFYKFSRACKILITLEPIEDQEFEESLKKDIENLRIILYNNMAECHLMRKNYEHAISLCNKVLLRDEKNIKALYRRAMADENLKDYENALIYMEKVVSLEPKNSLAKERAALYKKKINEAQKKFDDMIKKMFPIQN